MSRVEIFIEPSDFAALETPDNAGGKCQPNAVLASASKHMLLYKSALEHLDLSFVVDALGDSTDHPSQDCQVFFARRADAVGIVPD